MKRIFTLIFLCLIMYSSCKKEEYTSKGPLDGNDLDDTTHHFSIDTSYLLSNGSWFYYDYSIDGTSKKWPLITCNGLDTLRFTSHDTVLNGTAVSGTFQWFKESDCQPHPDFYEEHDYKIHYYTFNKPPASQNRIIMWGVPQEEFRSRSIIEISDTALILGHKWGTYMFEFTYKHQRRF